MIGSKLPSVPFSHHHYHQATPQLLSKQQSKGEYEGQEENEIDNESMDERS